jgi:prepilin-type N-terminal cleavage/methylation domain-containing protein
MIDLLKIKINKGISLIEILVVISILAIIVAIVVPNFSKFHNQQALLNTTEDVISLLNEARNNTISSKDSNTYGIHFETSKATLFAGTTYVINSSNKQIIFDKAVSIPLSGGIILNGGGSDVVFDRLTGETTKYGTVIVRLISDASSQKTINISKLGVIGSN